MQTETELLDYLSDLLFELDFNAYRIDQLKNIPLSTDLKKREAVIQHYNSARSSLYESYEELRKVVDNDGKI